VSTPSFEAVLARLKARFLQSCDLMFEMEYEPFSSPIEKVFIAAMVARAWAPGFIASGEAEMANRDALLDELGLEPGSLAGARFYVTSSRRCFAFAQHSMRLGSRTIRPDFAFVYLGLPEAAKETTTRVVVELDGHDFHERTPEQAQSDKSRDRELQAKGWHVLRFTGREVLRRPEECLEEVSGLLYAKALLEKQRVQAEQGSP